MGLNAALRCALTCPLGLVFPLQNFFADALLHLFREQENGRRMRPATNPGCIRRMVCEDYSLMLRRIGAIFPANDAENKEQYLSP